MRGWKGRGHEQVRRGWYNVVAHASQVEGRSEVTPVISQRRLSCCDEERRWRKLTSESG